MSMLRSVLTYMGLGPDEDYDDAYLYENERRAPSGNGRARRPEATVEPDGTIDLRDDPHAQRDRPTWLDDEEGPDAGRGPTGASSTPNSPSLGADRATRTTNSAEVATGRAVTAGAEPALSSAGASPTASDPRSSAETDRVRPLRAVPPTSVTENGDDGFTVTSTRTARPVVLAPRSFADAKTLADEFTAERPVVMNLQGVERDLARRLIDFASGVCYALGGGMEKLTTAVFLLTPVDVDVSDADRRRLESRSYRPE